MQCRAEAGSGISLTYSTVINDRCTTRGKIHRNLSSWYVDAQGFTELSDDLSADRSSPVPPCSPLEQGPPGYPPFPPNPQNTAMPTAGAQCLQLKNPQAFRSRR